MKFIICFVFVMLSNLICFCQSLEISADGKFVFAELFSPKENQPKFSALRSTCDSWYLELEGAENVKFGGDGKKAFYLKKGDLFIQSLGSKGLRRIRLVSNYTLEGNKKSFLIWKGSVNENLHIENLNSKRSFSIPNVTNYFMHPIKDILFVITFPPGRTNIGQQLIEINLTNQRSKVIWNGLDEKISKRCFSTLGECLAFFSLTKSHSSLWKYDLGSNQAKLLTNDSLLTQQYGPSHLERKYLQFVPNGSRVVYQISMERKFPYNKYSMDIKDLHSYLDPKPNFYWRADITKSKKYILAHDVLSDNKTIIETNHEVLVGSQDRDGVNSLQIGNDYALVYRFDKEIFSYELLGISVAYTAGQFNVNRYVHPDVFLVSLKDGSRRLIKSNVKVNSGRFPPFYLSPSGQQVVYFDNDLQQFFVFNILSGKIKQIVSDNICFINKEQVVDDYSLQQEYFGLASGDGRNAIYWLNDDPNSIVVADAVGDLWKLFLDGAKPTCLTKRTIETEGLAFVPDQVSNIIKNNLIQLLVLSSSDMRKKIIGKYTLDISKGLRAVQTMTPTSSFKMSEIKQSKSASVFIWFLESSTLPGTAYFGKSFNDGISVVKRKPNIDPVKQEILAWKDYNGLENNGAILFPRNFDPKKKYPVLVHYYYSDKEVTIGSKYLDYSTFYAETLLDYILFVPSIPFKVGYTSESISNAIILGTKELMKKPYVLTNKIGLYGGSFGGYETNCIIGQTNIFAAAYSVAGPSNLVNAIGLEDKDTSQRNHANSVSTGQINLGVDLWERPDLYLASSPVFYADRVSCPVLLLHNRQDYRVPFEHGIGFYKALQANGKKVWLDAPDGGHLAAPLGSVVGSKKARQFFGHYLKGEPAPYWMTRSALELLEKGLNPYEYDPEIKTPGEGIIPKEKTYAPQVLELLKHRTTINKEGRVVDIEK